ncbi:MAG: hypothetical protein GTN81_14540 [Proteobacteria bacterium]|nr:hypothetical protein [Pseudomonadota bacterium]
MECAKIKELLSEYIDDVLDEKEKTLVDNHLSRCDDCKAELVSLKAVVGELGSLESVRAPEDFLDRLHERLEPTFTFGKLMRVLFVPIRIKVPLEFATVAALAILIFYVSNLQQPEKRVATAPERSAPTTAAQKGRGETLDAIVEEKQDKPKAAVRKVGAEQPQRQRKTVELVLLLGEEVAGRAYTRDLPMETARVPEEGLMMSEEKVPSATPRPKPSSAAPAEPSAAPEREVMKKEKRAAADAQHGERAQLEREADSFLSNFDDLLSRIQRLIDRTGGKVIDIEYRDQTDLPESINAEIPADQYPSFLKELEQLAAVQAPPHPIAEEGKEPIQIRIRFIVP